MLEQIAYEVPRAVEQRQVVYQVEDLESLSASVLYNESKNNVKIDGTIETILPQFINDDTVKLYINSLNGKTDIAYQKGGEGHTAFANSGRMINISRGNGY